MRMTDARRRMYRNGLLGLLAIVMLSTIASPAFGSATPPVPGSAGTDTSLPDTDSAVTIRGRGSFSNLEIRVNQTRNLANQAISLKWTGGEATVSGSGRFSAEYLQVMQCWGEDDGSNPENPGPPPEQCVWGASDGVPETTVAGLFPPGSLSISRVVSRDGWENLATEEGFYDRRTGQKWLPFRAVDGTEVDVHVDPDYSPFVDGSTYWRNPYFSIITTNEIAAARTGRNGTGQELFRVDTGVESSGLGCGQRLPPPGGGPLRVPKCWLVIVPRGSAVAENVGTPFAAGGEAIGVFTAPLAERVWENRISVPLEFNAVDSACVLGEADRRIVGSELAGGAVASWQSSLCADPALPPYTYGTLSDAAARAQLSSQTLGAPGMAVTSRPLDAPVPDPATPVVYAPVTLSGGVIGFNIERTPLATAGQGAADLAGIRVAELNLTPRLVAKLLTQSYRSQVDIGSEPAPYSWRVSNPDELGSDPDFKQFNPEFELLRSTGGRNFGGLVLPGRNSDLTRQVWEWILADPEAKTWLDGSPDPWGMRVNPAYATTASANSNGAAFADPVPDSFPKNDPYCLSVEGGSNLCGTDWMPYGAGLREAGLAVRVATDGARVVQNPFAVRPDQFWRRAAPQTLGSRSILAVTDTASAALYGIQAARLSRAGDNGQDRMFVAPDEGGLTAGVGAMTARSDPAVLEADPLAEASAAYPLTTLTYAAIKPLGLDDQARREYAAFLDYAAGPGQVPGLEPGQLPRGYAPLSQALRGQAKGAADLVRTLQPPPPPPPPTAPSGSSTPPASSFAGSPASPTSATQGRTAATPTTVVASPPAPVAAVAAPEPESTSLLTPILSLARNRFVLPAMAVVAILAALGALEISKRPRRASTPGVGG